MSASGGPIHPSLTSGSAMKKGGAPEGARQDQKQMLSIAETPPKASLITRGGNGKFITASPDKRAADWLESQVAEAQKEVRSIVTDLTPALARVLLNRNDGNRKISPAVLTCYARDIRADAWQFNGEPIIVSRDGKLNDGQHRCEAVVEADRPIRVIMVFGVERDTRTTLDQGRTRTAGDFLAMRGNAYVNHLAAAASFAFQHAAFNRLAGGSKYRPTKSEILAFVDSNEDIIASVEFVQRKGADAVGGRSVLGFVHWALWKAGGRLNADVFTHALIDGANLPSGNPILYVRNRLINERGRMRANDKAELIFKAWNSWRTGKDTVRSYGVTGGPLPKLEA